MQKYREELPPGAKWSEDPEVKEMLIKRAYNEVQTKPEVEEFKRRHEEQQRLMKEREEQQRQRRLMEQEAIRKIIILSQKLA